MATRMTEGAEAPETRLIKVRVTFPVSRKGPYKADVTPETTVGSVRTGAMGWFEVSDDAQFVYVLTHAGVDQSNDTTVGDIAGKAHAVEFKLVKRITQGA